MRYISDNRPSHATFIKEFERLEAVGLQSKRGLVSFQLPGQIFRHLWQFAKSSVCEVSYGQQTKLRNLLSSGSATFLHCVS